MEGPRTESLQCEECGAQYQHTFTNSGGRPPKRCPAHRKTNGKLTDPEAYKAVRNARGKHQSRVKRSDEDERLDWLDAARLARRMSYNRDVRSAARACGFPEERIDKLAELARSEHLSLIEDDPSGIGQLCGDLIVDYMAAIGSRMNEVSARDLPYGLRALAQVRESYVGQGGGNEWAEVEIVVVPPGGEGVGNGQE